MQGWTGEYWEYAQWGDTLLGQWVNIIFFFVNIIIQVTGRL